MGAADLAERHLRIFGVDHADAKVFNGESSFGSSEPVELDGFVLDSLPEAEEGREDEEPPADQPAGVRLPC